MIIKTTHRIWLESSQRRLEENKKWVSLDSLLEFCRQKPYCNVRKLLRRELGGSDD